MNRKSSNKDNSEEFQFLIDLVGHSTILKYFAAFLGRPKCEIFIKDGNTRSTRNLKVPVNFSGLGFDGAHWKGYEKGKSQHDSYSKNIQSKCTNNYCQSFACYMWASNGLKNEKHGVELEERKYKDNVIKVSKLWVKCLKSLNKKQKNIVLGCIKGINLNIKLKDLFVILEKLSSDEHYAMEFACSKDSV